MMRTPTITLLVAFLFVSRAAAQQFIVKANPGKWRGDSKTEAVFPQFEIRIFTEDNSSDKQPLNSEGETYFDVERSSVRTVEWTTPQRPKFVLWPTTFKTSGQPPFPSPFTRLKLLSLKGLSEETKVDIADSIKKGGFDAAEDIFRSVNDVYQPYVDDPNVSVGLFCYQIYESMTDAAIQFRKSGQYRRLSAENRAKILEIEREWHRSMLDRYTGKADDETNRTLASTLRRWSEFARAAHCGTEWPSDSINTSKDKQPATVTGDLAALHEDLGKVTDALFSNAIAPGLRERIKQNLSPGVRKGPTPLETKHISSYESLAALREKSDFSVDSIRLDELDRAISGFQYFYHVDADK